MGVRQKQRWLLLVLLMILTFIGTFVYLLPYLFKLPFIHVKTETFVARQIRGDFTFREGSLTFFPRPCIRIRDAALKTGYGVSAAIEMVSAYPDLPSLFLGKFNVARVTVIRPNCIAEIPETEAPPPLSNHSQKPSRSAEGIHKHLCPGSLEQLFNRHSTRDFCPDPGRETALFNRGDRQPDTMEAARYLDRHRLPVRCLE